MFALFLSLFTTPCNAAFTVTLRWDANTEPELLRYEAFYREDGQSYDYDNPQWQGTDRAATEVQFSLPNEDTKYYFVVRAVAEINGEEVPSLNSREVCVYGPTHPGLGPYDTGWAITSGHLKGFMILYNDPVNFNDDKPTLGPSSAIPPLHLLDTNAVGVPINLQPATAPGDNFFNPVKVFIPCPGYAYVNGLDIYYWDGINWSLANDAWMVPKSREDYNNGSPSTIAFQVYHFSGVQAGATSEAGGGGGGVDV